LENIRLGEVIILDILQNSQDLDVIGRAANSFFTLHASDAEFAKKVGRDIPISSAIVKFLAELALNPRFGSAKDRVEMWNLFVSDHVENPPISSLDFREIRDHPQEEAQLIKQDLEKLQAWYSERKAELEESAQQEKKELEAIRNQLQI
jgi:hypothetical protein